MNFFRKYWYVILLSVFTGALGVIVLLTSQKLRQEESVAPTVPQVTPEASSCASLTSRSACDSAGCVGGFTCRWSTQQQECKKTENRCAGPTPPTRGYDGADAGDFCSGSSCDVGSAFSSNCYVNHYVSKETDDPTVTDLVKSGVAKSSLGYQNCGAEQIDATCNGKNDSVSRRYTQDCGEKTTTSKTQTKTTASPTPTQPPGTTPTPSATSTPTATPTQTVTATPTQTATPTPTQPPGTTPTPTTTAFAPTPTSTTAPTPNVPIAGTGPSILGASVIAGGVLLLLLGFLF